MQEAKKSEIEMRKSNTDLSARRWESFKNNFLKNTPENALTVDDYPLTFSIEEFEELMTFLYEHRKEVCIVEFEKLSHLPCFRDPLGSNQAVFQNDKYFIDNFGSFLRCRQDVSFAKSLGEIAMAMEPYVVFPYYIYVLEGCRINNPIAGIVYFVFLFPLAVALTLITVVLGLLVWPFLSLAKYCVDRKSFNVSERALDKSFQECFLERKNDRNVAMIFTQFYFPEKPKNKNLGNKNDEIAQPEKSLTFSALPPDVIGKIAEEYCKGSPVRLSIFAKTFKSVIKIRDHKEVLPVFLQQNN